MTFKMPEGQKYFMAAFDRKGKMYFLTTRSTWVRFGGKGKVLATESTSDVLGFAEHSAADAGLKNVIAYTTQNWARLCAANEGSK